MSKLHVLVLGAALLCDALFLGGTRFRSWSHHPFWIPVLLAAVQYGTNAGLFAAMPQGSHFINVSRGEIAIEKDVIAALQSGHLAGAYLDVFEREPLDPASPLWDMPNVLISPHTASHSQGQNEAIFEIFLDNLARFRGGRKLRNDVDDLG